MTERQDWATRRDVRNKRLIEDGETIGFDILLCDSTSGARLYPQTTNDQGRAASAAIRAARYVDNSPEAIAAAVITTLAAMSEDAYQKSKSAPNDWRNSAGDPGAATRNAIRDSRYL